MSFETWTKSIGLLGHAGVGLSFLERKDPATQKTEWVT
jgi:OOP family OmpA-OmpF porin